MAGVDVEVLELDLGEVPGAPGVEFVLDRVADAVDAGAGKGGLFAEGVGEGRLVGAPKAWGGRARPSLRWS